jgi:hypothetical protein
MDANTSIRALAKPPCRGIVVDPSVPERLVIRSVELATPLPHEAIVRVAAIQKFHNQIINYQLSINLTS